MNWTEIYKALFPDGITAEFIAAVIVGIIALVTSIYGTTIKKKITTQDVQKSKSETASASAEQKSQEAINAVTLLSNMLLTIFLNANTLDSETKKQLVSYSEALEALADVELSNEVHKALDVVAKFSPEASILEKREQLETAANQMEDYLDKASDATSSLIDKIKLGD
jgi:hypothetical protein